MSDRVQELIALGQRVVADAKKRGADVAEVLARDSADLSAKVHMGKIELIEEAASSAIGLRVLKNGRCATTYTSDTTPRGLDALVADAIELALLSEPDELAMPPDKKLLAKDAPNLDLYDDGTRSLDAKEATRRALEAEAAARAHDARISNTDGVVSARSYGATALVTSDGFANGYASSYQSLSVSTLADDAEGKKRIGHDWDARRYETSMRTPKDIGIEAAKKTLAQLGAKKIETSELPIVFHPDAGRSLLSLLFSCVAGTAIYKRASYLLESEGEAIASSLCTIVDDPLIARAPGSRPFDGEGLPSRKNLVVDKGRLVTFLLDTYSARKLKKESTGSAARGIGGSPSVSPTNFHLLPGMKKADDIIGEVDRGLYVTSMMGFGFNPVTGDFSRGAEGFLIEKGKLGAPVSEVTISLGFKELWSRVDAIADDLDPKSSFATPTFRVSRMTVAGS